MGSICSLAPVSSSTSSAKQQHQLKEGLQMADIEVDGSTSLVVLLIQNQERRQVVKRYLERLKIKMLIVKHREYLQGHLSRLKTKVMPLSQNSNISSDWIVNDYYISRRKCEEPTTTFTMFLIDVSSGPPKELAAMVEEFRSDVTNVVISKVVWLWLNGGDGHGRVDDVFLSKALHGSRLQQVVKMLPEFGGGCVTGSSKTSQKPNVVGVRQRITSKKVSHD